MVVVEACILHCSDKARARTTAPFVHSLSQTLVVRIRISTMTCVHIVLFKVKAQVLKNGYEEFKARAETIRDLPIVKEHAKELQLGPPIWDTRSHGFNYGLYSVFETRESLERYKEDNDHKEYVYELE